MPNIVAAAAHRRRSRLRAVPVARTLLGLAGILVVLPGFGMRQNVAAPVRFREHLLDTIPGAYHVAVADINGDGKPDILAISETQNFIAWYENPTWKKHILTTAAPRPIDITAYDLDGDGKLEITVNSEFNFSDTHTGGRVLWFKRAADPDAEWVGHEVASVPTAHRSRWADWDGNHKKELAVVPILGPGAAPPDYSAPVSIVSYAFTGGKVTAHPIDRSLTLAHGVCVLDFDGDGRDDLLVASVEGLTWFKPAGKGAKRTWTKTHLADGLQPEPGKPPKGEGGPGRGCSEIERGWLKGKKNGKKRPFLVTIEPWHGNEVVVYLPPANGKGQWSRHLIDDSLAGGHALACVDLDGSGQDEIVAGGRGGARTLYGYRCVDAEGLKWERFVIDAGDMPAAGLVAADINGDGRPDLVAAGSGNGKVKYYENLGP